MNNLILLGLLFVRLHPFGGNLAVKFEQIYAERYLQPQKQLEQLEQVKYNSVPSKQGADIFYSNSAAIYAIDLKTNTILTDKNSRDKKPIASITKLMTAYLTLKDLPLDNIITINSNYVRPGDATVNLQTGDRLTVSQTLLATLVNSASEGAISLSIADSGSPETFVAKMNQTAKELGLNDTHFTNPVGWDDENNYSSAQDIASLTRILLRNDYFSDIVSTKSTQLKTIDGKVVNLENTNQLLGSNGFTGVKTGFTNIAGECLVSLNKQGEREVLTVVLGSNNRFGETQQLINWISTHFLW